MTCIDLGNNNKEMVEFGGG